MKWSNQNFKPVFKEYLFIILILIFGGRLSTHATIMGAEMKWDCIGQDSFMVTLSIYRDCNENDIEAINVKVNCAKDNTLLQTINIPKPEPIDVTPVCERCCTRCENPACSYPFGIEQYEYSKLLVLNSPSSCCKIKISWESCCRGKRITTGLEQKPFYIEGILNRCLSPCDNSPRLNEIPIQIICIGRDNTVNFKAYDNDYNETTKTADSLTYELVPPKGSNGEDLTYSGSYNFDKPLYFWGFPDNQLNGPRGFHLNQSTGLLTFRPMNIEETMMAIKITEFRNGENIGEITRNIQFIVISCPNAQAPYLSGPFYKEICAGSTVSFNIRTIDKDPNDTLTISWNENIPGAVWTDNNGQTRHPTGTLSWTPSEQHASNIPYVFIVTVKDDAYPVNSVTSRAYQVLVRPLPRARIKVADSGCNDIYFFVQPLVGANPEYQWNSNFSSGFQSTQQSFHYMFEKTGIYPFSMTMTSKSNFICSRIYFDTIIIDTIKERPTVNLGADIFMTTADTTILDAGPGYSSYHWNNNTTSQTNIIRGWQLGAGNHPIVVMVKNDIGCTNYDTVYVNLELSGINENADDILLKIYPNPNDGVFILEYTNKNNEEINISIIGLDGQTLFQKTIDKNNSSFIEEINLQGKPKGQYLLVVEIGGEKVLRKVVVM
jgi:hypothetical protein